MVEALTLYPLNDIQRAAKVTDEAEMRSINSVTHTHHVCCHLESLQRVKVLEQTLEEAQCALLCCVVV